MILKTSRRFLSLERPLVMGILNVTRDSFSDGGQFSSFDAALKRVEEMVAEGADIVDIGGESTRPGSKRISEHDEIARVVPIIEAACKRFDISVSIDTTKSRVAKAAIDAGAEIINDISGLRWDPDIAKLAAENGTAVVLMHSRGSFETMHSQPPVGDIMVDISNDFRRSIAVARAAGIDDSQIVLDVGIGFGKTFEQNLELLAKLDKLVDEFPGYPMLAGASRKSFIGKLLEDAPPDKRLAGSLASVAIAVWNGAKIVRVHDVKATVEAVEIAAAVRDQS